jgi:hypothetical protein
LKCDEDVKDALQLSHCLQLNDLSAQFIEAIISEETIKTMPYELRCVGKILKGLADSHEWSLPPILGNLIMLRIFNTAIVFPEKNPFLDVTKIDGIGRRNLILISKLLQNLANGVEFGTKEEYMLPMNETIQKYLKNTSDYFVTVAEINEDEFKIYSAKKEEEIVAAYQNHTIYTQVFEDLRRIHELIVKHQDKFEKHIKDTDSKNDILELLAKLPKIDKQELDEKKNDLLKIEDEKSPKKSFEPITSYDKTLLKAKQTDLSTAEFARILTMAGKDRDGQPTVIFFEGHMKDVDSNVVFLYFCKTMDAIVKSNYCLVWIVDNSSNASRPGFSWLLNAYRTISYDYRKNLKGFYLIHPTFVYKTIFQFFKPFVSKKFWVKLHSCNEVCDVSQWIDKEELALPPQILMYDYGLQRRFPVKIFGKGLGDLLERKSETGRRVPRIYQNLMDFLEFHGANEEGIFRVGGKSDEVQTMKVLIDNDDNIDFSFVNIHSVASIFKQLFRELEPPLLTYECYNNFVDAMAMGDQADIIRCMQKIVYNLPASHYDTTKHLFAFLHKIHQKSSVNKMTAENLGIVFGVNLLRGKDLNLHDTLKHNSAINKCTQILIADYAEIFSNSNKRRHRSALVRKTVVQQEETKL